jgi:hypothetical protein
VTETKTEQQPTNPTSQAVAKQDSTAIIAQYSQDFAAVLPTHIKPDQWLRLTQGMFRRDKNLARILERNPGSVLAALLDAARLGLDVGDTYHLIPFGNEVVGTEDYTGLIELIYSTPKSSSQTMFAISGSLGIRAKWNALCTIRTGSATAAKWSAPTPTR